VNQGMTTMTRLLLLDKDGTLTVPKSGGAFPQHPKDQRLREGVEQALKEYADDGWTMAIVSNQGGVAAKHKTIDSAIAEMRYAMQLTGIKKAYFCPDFAGADCWFVEPDTAWMPIGFSGSYRKPNPGMLQIAIAMSAWLPDDIRDGQLIRENILMVGDRPEDQQAAFAAGVPFFWVDEWIAQ